MESVARDIHGFLAYKHGPRTSRQLSQEHSCTSFTDLLDSGSDGQTLRG